MKRDPSIHLYHGDNAGPPTALVWSARGAWVRVVRWDGGAHLLATVATVAPPQHVSVSPSGQGCDSLYDSLYDSLVTAYLALGVTLVSVKPSLSNLSRISDSRSMLNDNLETNVASLNSISSWQCVFTSSVSRARHSETVRVETSRQGWLLSASGCRPDLPPSRRSLSFLPSSL